VSFTESAAGNGGSPTRQPHLVCTQASGLRKVLANGSVNGESRFHVRGDRSMRSACDGTRSATRRNAVSSPPRRWRTGLWIDRALFPAGWVYNDLQAT